MTDFRKRLAMLRAPSLWSFLLELVAVGLVAVAITALTSWPWALFPVAIYLGFTSFVLGRETS